MLRRTQWTRIFVVATIVVPILSPIAVAEDERHREEACIVVILGASYAKSWPIAAIGELTVMNRGIGGNQSFEMAERFESDVVALKPRSVLLWGFINDIFRSPPGQIGKTKAQIMSSYETMIKAARENGIRVMIATEVPIREPSGVLNWLAGVIGGLRGKESYQSKINSIVVAVNDDLRALASRLQVPILDFHRIFVGPGGSRIKDYATDDGSHITSSAYDALSDYVQQSISLKCEPRYSLDY